MTHKLPKKDEPDELKSSEEKVFTFLENLSEFIGGLVIVVSLSTFSALIGLIIYIIVRERIGFILMIIVFGIGVVFSIFYALHIWRTKGTVNFISNTPTGVSVQDDHL